MRRWLAIAALVAACGDDAPPRVEEAPVPAPPADAIVKEQDLGPAKVTVQVWPAQPTLGDSIWLRLAVETDEGVTAELPFDQAALGRFAVLRYLPEREGRRSVDVYELAAPMSGRHRIPPLRVVVDGAEVLTDEIPLEVGAVLAARTDQPLHGARAAIDTRVGGRTWWPVILGAGGVLLVGGGVAGWVLLRGRRTRRAQVSAWELAMRRLAELEARGAPPADDPAACDAWFVELSAIVRAYVEGRYRLRAPELTTEEFLTEARRIPELDGAHRDLLGSFLERCDRVKFAGWRPEASESLELLGVARAFVSETRVLEAAA